MERRGFLKGLIATGLAGVESPAKALSSKSSPEKIEKKTLLREMDEVVKEFHLESEQLLAVYSHLKEQFAPEESNEQTEELRRKYPNWEEMLYVLRDIPDIVEEFQNTELEAIGVLEQASESEIRGYIQTMRELLTELHTAHEKLLRIPDYIEYNRVDDTEEPGSSVEETRSNL